jgi:hypothetical protein
MFITFCICKIQLTLKVSVNKKCKLVNFKIGFPKKISTLKKLVE